MATYKNSNVSQTSRKVQRSSSEATTDTGTLNSNVQSEQELDMRALADKVYSLLRQELQLEQERLGYKKH